MINIGINGFGRIGKCVFLQLLSNDQFQIKCINASSMTVHEIQQYLEYDSTHHYPNKFDFQIIGKTSFSIGRHIIELFQVAIQLNFRGKIMVVPYLLMQLVLI